MNRVKRSHLSWLGPMAMFLSLICPLNGRMALAAPAAPAVTCNTTVGGPLSGNTTWTPAGSPYCVTSSVYVPSGITLTVQAGVSVLVNANLIILVDGAMVARGSASRPITFTAAGSTAPGAWKGILLSTLATPTRYTRFGRYAGGSAFRFAAVTYAGGSGANGALELDVPVMVDHSTIQGSAVAGLYEPASHASITNSTISGNLATGLYLGGGSDTISGNTISGNKASNGNSAGIYIESGGGDTISGNLISGNTATAYGEGAGIFTRGADTIANNTISANSTDSHGGGIYSGGADTITGNLISGNYSGLDGGGIFGTGDSITGNTIISNTASYLGGGINGSSNTISNDTISGNAAGQTGGGIDAGNGVIFNATVSNNSAGVQGGGIYLSGSGAVSQTVISGNRVTGSSSLGAGVYCNCGSSGTTLQADSIISNTAPAAGTAAGLDVTGYPLLSDNSLCANTPYDLGDRNPFSASTTLNATNNFWGITNTAVIQSHIYDFFKNASLERVSFTPFLSAPVPPALACP